MLGTFLRHYLELPQDTKNVACLGGGIGTAQLLKGLRDYPYNLTAVVSMADDGGSAGRLRRAFAVPPPGDLVNCLAALSAEESVLKDLFLYRFAGKRYGKDTDLGGQKLGNLIFVALTDICKGDTNKALEEFSRIISPKGTVMPATVGDVNIWAKNKAGKKIYGEENIDLGKYGTKSLSEVHLDPQNVKAYEPAIRAIVDAKIIIAGPGDLFSTVLPVLLVSQIKKELKKSKATRIYVINIANKPFETFGFKVSDHIKTIFAHVGADCFDKILVNTNFGPKIPPKLHYRYVEYDPENLKQYRDKIIEGDLVDEAFPVYHDSSKMAKIIERLSK
ncbi:MAG TPA: uridine diphosphate-N-acetylglucosamine-binding protein YvcK [Candidatus Saccharimonadales bacterium]|nr:uridine diphosphate-N-acetylglucosamine-binding protein YvcK [Candidatus Saccharimonadales bacterium]